MSDSTRQDEHERLPDISMSIYICIYKFNAYKFNLYNAYNAIIDIDDYAECDKFSKPPNASISIIMIDASVF